MSPPQHPAAGKIDARAAFPLVLRAAMPAAAMAAGRPFSKSSYPGDRRRSASAWRLWIPTSRACPKAAPHGRSRSQANRECSGGYAVRAGPVEPRASSALRGGMEGAAEEGVILRAPLRAIVIIRIVVRSSGNAASDARQRGALSLAGRQIVIPLARFRSMCLRQPAH